MKSGTDRISLNISQ